VKIVSKMTSDVSSQLLNTCSAQYTVSQLKSHHTLFWVGRLSSVFSSVIGSDEWGWWVVCTAHLEKIAFSCRLALTCSSAWVDCPAYLELMNMQRQFTVKLNPIGLSAGVHFAEVTNSSFHTCCIYAIVTIIGAVFLVLQLL